MGRSLRSKRGLMLRAAKAAAVDPIRQQEFEEQSIRLQQVVAVQNGQSERPAAVKVQPDDLPSGDVPVVIHPVVDLRAEITMSGGNVLVQGERKPVPVHHNPSINKIIDSTDITRYRPSQMSYYATPAESVHTAQTFKSAAELQYTAAHITEDLKPVIAQREEEEKSVDPSLDPRNQPKAPRQHKNQLKGSKLQRRKYDLLDPDTDMLDPDNVNRDLSTLTGNLEQYTRQVQNHELQKIKRERRLRGVKEDKPLVLNSVKRHAKKQKIQDRRSQRTNVFYKVKGTSGQGKF